VMETSAQPQTPPKKSKVGFIILGIILAILLLGVGGFFLWKSIEKSNLEAGEAVIMAFMKDYDRLRLEDAYEHFYSDVREETIEDQLDKYSVSDLDELGDFLDMYFGGLDVEYEINKSKRLSKEELEDVLSEVYSTLRVRLDISKAYAYQVTETFSGKNGTLKLIEQYVVAKEDGEWYIIAILTNKIVKDDVTFTFSENEDDVLDTLEAFMEAYGRLDLESAYQFFHPDVKDTIIELIMGNFSLDEYAEALSGYYGGYSLEYEVLQSRYLSDRERNDLISETEEYYGVRFNADFSDACACEIKETISGDNGTAVIIETFYFGKEDGQWYILDITTDELVDSDVQIQNPGGSVSGYDDSEGFDSGEDALDQFVQKFYPFNLEESFKAVHPVIREAYLQRTLDYNNVSSIEEYDALVTSTFGYFEYTYEITEQYKISDDELKNLLSYVYRTYGVQLNLSECILYSIAETYELSDETVNLTEVIAVGKDGDKWYVIEGLAE
ncbi:MAG: hypothetical protein K2K96_00335, partial [Lachnospiraceae bacterium]|nr:hypothetical protein [Lachnospiraceae bacterium]